jgi:hypothetical protein
VAVTVKGSNPFYDDGCAAIHGKANVLEKWCDGKKSSKKLPLVYSIIWFITKKGLPEKTITKLKFMHIFKK